MKTQLLEDIGENHSLPIDPPEHTAAAPTADKWHAGLWRQRDAAPAAPAFAEPPPPPPPAPAPILHSLDPDPLAECWAIANPTVEPTWFERWGRRTAAWSAAFMAVVLMAGGAAWLYNETRANQALAVASSALDAPVAAYVAPPVRSVDPIDVAESELAPLESDFYSDVPDFDAAPVVAKPKRPRVRTVAKAPRRAAPPPPAPAVKRESRMAETLRQCRAAGYHAEQCIKRSCVATPYGIACKG